MKEHDVSRKLNRLYEKFKDRDLLIWAYCCLTSRGMEDLADIESQSGSTIFKNFQAQKATNSFMRWIFSKQEDLNYEKFYNGCVRQFTSGSKDIAGDYRIVSSQNDLARKIDPGTVYFNNTHYLRFFNSTLSLTRYAYFQNVYILFDEIEKTSWPTVENAIQGKKSIPERPVFAEAEPLSFNVPAHDPAAIAEQAKKLVAKNYNPLSCFGLAEELDGGNAIAAISNYLTRRAARPGQTLEQIDAIMDNAATLRNTQFVKEDPGRLARLFGAASKIRMTDIAETPFKPLLDLANGLPVKAGDDKVRYESDIAVLTRGKDIAAAYYTLFGDLYEALKAEQPRLVAEADMFSSGVANVIETRLGALQEARQTMMAHALSFDRLAATIGITMGRLGAMAATAAKIHTPIINAMTVYQLYALRRMNAFGQAVDAQVLKSVKLTQDALTDVASTTPDRARTNIGQALSVLIQGCEALNLAFRADIEQQTEEIRALGEQLMLGAHQNTRQAAPVPAAPMPAP